MDSGPFKLSTVIGVGASLALHAGVATWLVVAPPTITTAVTTRIDRAEGVDISLGDFVQPLVEPVRPTDPPQTVPPPQDPAARTEPQQTPPPLPPPPEIEPEPIDLDKIILGIDKSNAPKETKAFLGEAVPTPHAAPLSEVEQPELTIKPAAAPGDPGPVGPEGAEETPEPAVEAKTAPTESLTLSPAPLAQPEPLGQPLPVAPALPPTPEAAPNPEGDGLSKAPPIEIDPFGTFAFIVPDWVGGGGIIVFPKLVPNEATGTPTPPTPPTPPAEVTPKVETPSPASGGGGGGEKAKPGEVAGKESSAFTIKKTQDFKPGKTLAPEGIEVTTFDPEIPVLSSITGTLRNPVIEMRFGPDGKVKAATFKNGLTSGRKDWDEPILHAMHRWTIGGKKFKELLAEKPSREVVMTIRMILTR